MVGFPLLTAMVVIPAIGAALVKLYPAPNSADPARNYFGTPKGLSDNKVPSARVDHQLGAKDNLWGRFTMNAPQRLSLAPN